MNDSYREWITLGREVLNTEILGLQAVSRDLGHGFARGLEILSSCQGRIVISGVGKSGLVGRKMAATFSSTGTPSFFLHPVEGAHGDLGMIRKEDVLIAISNSGETEELNAIIPAIRNIGPSMLALTSEPESTIAQWADITIKIKVPQEACPLGLAPTSSTTATLAVGDALAVGLIRIKAFSEKDFQKNHPGGTLGQRLALDVGQIMHRENIPQVFSRSPLEKALSVLNERGLGTVILVDESSRLKGILTDGDVRRLICHGNPDRAKPAEIFMTPDPQKVTPKTSAAKAMDIMEEKAITVIPVVEGDNRLCGIVHMHDLLGKGFLKFANGRGGA